MSVNNKRRRVKVGDIFAIDLGEGTYGYAIVLESGITGFFDLKTYKVIENVNEIKSKNILFKVCVMNYAYKNENWLFIGNVGLSGEMKEKVYFFKQDHFDYTFSIYHEEGVEGIEIPANYEDVKNLERAAVWDPEHVEDRLRDYFNGVPNVWVEQLKPKLLKS